MLEGILVLIVKVLGLVLPFMIFGWLLADILDYIRNKAYNWEDTLGYILITILVVSTIIAILL